MSGECVVETQEDLGLGCPCSGHTISDSPAGSSTAYFGPTSPVPLLSEYMPLSCPCPLVFVVVLLCSLL